MIKFVDSHLSQCIMPSETFVEVQNLVRRIINWCVMAAVCSVCPEADVPRQLKVRSNLRPRNICAVNLAKNRHLHVYEGRQAADYDG
jgi:hypothetical protein